MYRFLFFLSCSLVACTNQQSSDAVTTVSGDSMSSSNSATVSTLPTDSAIAYIRRTFQQINAASLKSQTFEWAADNCGEGTATYYFTSNSEIAKVVETGAIGDGSWTIAYYYQDRRFIFSLETNIGGPAIGPVDTFTIRKYVYADKVIRTMRDKTDTTPPDSVLTSVSKEYRIREAFRNKNFGAAFCK